MHINKKAYTTFIITVLTLSVILAAMPMVSAIASAPTLYVPASPPVTLITGGPVGTKVMVVGVDGGAGDASPFSTVTIYWDSLGGQVLGTTAADVNGAWAINVTIPSAITGTHYIVAKDDGAAQGAPFAVTASLRAATVPPSTPPVRVLPGDSVSLTGHGYAASSAITVTLDSTTLATPVSITLTTPTITTNATGDFSAVIVIPSTMTPADYDVYDVTATDAALTAATTQVTIDYYITVLPTSGPSGITITISGRIVAATAYDIRIDTTTIATGTSGSDGRFTNTYVIPALIALGAHTVSVYWATTIHKDTSFTVSSPPALVLGSPSGIAGATVTITGSGFSGRANITLVIGTTTVNSTAADSRFGPTSTGGAFSEEFVVPALAPGVYVLTVTDQYGASTGTLYTFQVLPTPVFMVATRATEYVRMDFISLVSSATTAADVDLVITDPTGLIFYADYIAAGDWQKIGASWQIPYFELYLTWWPITSDAPLGTWNFTCYAAGTTTILDTNLFTVAAKPDMQDVLDKLDGVEANLTDILTELEATLTDVVTDSEGEITAVINTKAGQITADIAALDAKITSIDGTLVTISTSIGDVQTAVSALDLGTMGVDITSIKGDVAIIKTNLGTVTTAVSALDAKVTTISGNVATVSTNLGTLQGTVTSIDGKVATIDTSVGTIQADVTDIKAKPDVDMTPAWIAVVLSLIAAIAACFAVVTIRQKIAG